MKILITGGAGFIGSHLVDGILKEGHEVKVLDNLHSGNLQNLEPHMKDSSFQFLKGDVRNEKDVKEAMRGVDAVFHEAAITSVPASVKNPELTEEVNVGGTVNLLKRSLSEGVQRFIFASSCAVYGDAKEVPINENSRLKPDSPYAVSKLAGEKKCLDYEGNELSTVTLRYFNVYGPRQSGGRYAGVISKFLERLEDNKAPIIYGDGKQTRDFVYVNDIVRANLIALRGEDVSGRAFNIGSGNAISINELCETLLEILGKNDIEPIYKEARAGDIRHSRADLDRASEELDYRPQTSLKDGLKRLLKERKNS